MAFFRKDPFMAARGEDWTGGDQPIPNSLFDQAKRVGTLAGTVAGIYQGAKFVNQRWLGGKGWDYALQGIRTLEEYSPGRILRTFQLSHLLSPLESASTATKFFLPEHIHSIAKSGVGRTWLENLSNQIGEDILTGRVSKHGFAFKNNQLLLLNQEQDVLLQHAVTMRSPTGSHAVFQEGVARSVAGGNLEDLSASLKLKVPFGGPEGEELEDVISFIGGKNKLQTTKRMVSGWGTSAIERLNKLAKQPAELPIISNLYSKINKIPGFSKFSLGVESSSGLKTLAKLTGKLGLLGGGLYLGYKELDYRVRKSGLFENTMFDEGITAAAASVWTRGQIKISEAAAATGLHSFRERQERVAPGSTELSKLIAFPIMGALGGLGLNYGLRIKKQLDLQAAGFGLAEASAIPSALEENFKAHAYDRGPSQKAFAGISEEGMKLIQEETEKKLGSWEGKVAGALASKQTNRSILGSLSRLVGEVSPNKLRWMGGAAIGTALILPFLPGALVPSDRPEELEALYSGQKKVEIRKGRWWEAGRTPWEGNTIDRYQQHWFPRMLARAKDKSIYGEDEPSPIGKWFKKNFTYEIEREHYSDRPYPITGGFGEDIPFIGPIVSSTLGRLIKPPALMHQEEFFRTNKAGEEEYKEMPPKFHEVESPGERGQGAPISPFGVKSVVGEEIYRAQEAVGLPGFTLSSVYARLTGNQDVFAQEAMMESAGRITSAERDYWDKEMGGLAGTSELFRRLYPHRRREIPLYNPLENNMPSWMPGPGERSPDFRHGDPFTKVQLGEERLPGAGYAALYPELEGVAPERYPLIHRLSILADIAPYSSQYGETLGQVKKLVSEGRMSSEDINQYHQTMAEISARKTKKEFSPYQYKEQSKTPMEKVLADINESSKEDGGPSWFERTIGSYWENLAHKSETPLEYLTPVSPASKFVHMRTALEDYQKTQLYGTQSGFWEHPVRDFLKPFATSTAHAAGTHSIPSEVEERRSLEDYFDVLKYVKATRLEKEAEVQGDTYAADEAGSQRRETMFGVNPYTFNYTHIMRGLPRRERDYFDAFSQAPLEERAEIYSSIPENERALMNARWQMKDAADIQKVEKAGLLTAEQKVKADEVLASLYDQRENQGMPKDKQLWAEYNSDRLPQESYPDWYRRTKLLSQKLEGRSLPGPDWVGWHGNVDLEDIKMKVVTDEGKNAFEYDLWPDRLRNLARKPIVEEAATQLQQAPGMSQEALRERVNDVLLANGIQRAQINIVSTGASGTTTNMSFKEDRSRTDKEQLRRSLANAKR